jgi:DnaJ like chaperone protein
MRFAFWGKLVGLLVGSLGGLYGAILGLLIGHLVDEILAERRRRNETVAFLRGVPGDGSAAAESLLVAIVGMAFGIARMGGPPTVAQIEHIRQILDRRFDLSKRERYLVRTAIRESFRRPDAVDPVGLAASHRWNRELGLFLISLLVRIAIDDQAGLSPEREAVLLQICETVGVSDADFVNLSGPESASVEESYRLLGLEPGTPIDEVRRVYRRLAAQFHPDAAADLGVERQKQAEEAFKKIQAAYRQILDATRRDTPDKPA